jgi:hypothetical protein
LSGFEPWVRESGDTPNLRYFPESNRRKERALDGCAMRLIRRPKSSDVWRTTPIVR